MPFITLVMYLFLWKAVQKKEGIIFIYCLVNTLLFSFSDALSLQRLNNLPFYHISSLLELWIVSYYLLKIITGKNWSYIFWVVNIAYLCFFIFNVTFLEKWTVFNSNTAVTTSLIILFLSMYYLLKLSKSDEILYFQKLPSFWFASAFLIYNAVSILVLLSYKYFLNEKMFGQGNSLWFVLSVANIVKFALISTGLLCHRKRPAIHSLFLL